MRQYLKAALVSFVSIGLLALWLGSGMLRAGKLDGKDSYNLAALRVLNRVILLVRENYVDPARIKPQKMLTRALDYVQRRVAEIMIRNKPDDKVEVEVDGVKQEFSVEGIENLWEMSFKLRDIFQFVQTHFKGETKLRDIEYAAINGMLKTLDPHSFLLRPEIYKEMTLSTKGHFGGLGIVISIREGKLTVIAPLEDTPAWRAGIKAQDNIVRIEEESTINMSLTEAVNRLRGKAGTKVVIWIMRKGWGEARKYIITRADIKIRSVKSKLLKGGIGYIKVKNFQGNTIYDLRTHIRKLKKKAGKDFRGLILDLRNNPGGLLKSAVDVADAFIAEGTIVTTVGIGNKLREVQKANFAGTEGKYAMAVLINGGSASASEIVSGALKNLGRAIIVGQKSFGKGTVQVLYRFRDGSALKLTIAEYLTTGNRSIQSLGITPDILTIPVVIDKENMDFFKGHDIRSERDLKKHFQPKGKPGKPVAELRYFKEAPPKDEKKKKKLIDSEYSKIIKEDFQMKLARTLLLKSAKGHTWTQKTIMKRVKGVLDLKNTVEFKKISKALKKLDIDWTPGPSKGKPRARITITASGKGRVNAGDKLTLTATVENLGGGDFRQLRAITKSKFGTFKNREFIFGHIPAKAKKSWSIKIKVPKAARDRLVPIKLEFHEQNGRVPKAKSTKIRILTRKRPIYAFSYQIIDSKGNGDGLIQSGEELEMILNVWNKGKGKANKTLTMIKNLSGKGIFIKKGRIKIAELKPGESKSVRFSFRILPIYTKSSFRFEFGVIDTVLQTYLSDKVKFHIVPKRHVLKKEKVWVRINKDRVPVHGGAKDDTPVIAHAPKGSVLEARARCKSLPPMMAARKGGVGMAAEKMTDWLQVEIGNGRSGWLKTSQVDITGKAPQTPLPLHVQNEPPLIKLSHGSNKLLIKKESVTLKGLVTHSSHIRDVYVFHNKKKVFYRATKRNDAKSMNFSIPLALKKGHNRILVVARKTRHLTNQVVLHLLRE